MLTRDLVITASFVLLVPTAPALSATAVGKPVHFSTCTLAGVEHDCIIAKGDDGATYNVTGALPSLKAKQWLQGTGTVSDRMSYCMQGNTIEAFVPDNQQTHHDCRH